MSIPLPPSPKSAKTVSRGTFIPVVIATFVFGVLAGGGAARDNKSSDLDAANKRISQLESQVVTSVSQAPAAESPAPVPPTTDKPTTEPAPAAALTLSGDGRMKSKKVALKGDYGVSWTTLGSCYYSADLESEGDTWGESVFTASDAPHSGTNNVYGLDAADYYLDVITGPAPSCGWSVTLTPIP